MFSRLRKGSVATSLHAKRIWSCFYLIGFSFLLMQNATGLADASDALIDLGLSSVSYQEDKVPAGWRLKKHFWYPKGYSAKWVIEDGIKAVKLQSDGALTFLQRAVDIDIKEFPIVSWQWKVENLLNGIDERTEEGDDHPIRIFFVFEPDTSRQSLLFRFKRLLYLDRVHGHPMGGRFTEYLWSSHLKEGEIIDDPGKPWQKLMVIEGGNKSLRKWMRYKRNLYDDFRRLYGEEPRKLIFVGILNDTDRTGQQAVSYVRDLSFSRK